MKAPLPAAENVEPDPAEVARRTAKLSRNSENERWENEGAVSARAKRPDEPLPPASKCSAKTEYVVLISGLLIGFGLVTLIMTIGAAREEAAMAAAMTAYGGVSVAVGAAVAGTFWLWRSLSGVPPRTDAIA